MAQGDKNKKSSNRIAEKQRMTYIGFEVFPGKPKDLFKSEAERNKLIEGVRAKRGSDTTLRDECKLLEERVSMGERIVLAVASVAILAALLLPWYSAYMVVEAAPVAADVTEETDPLADSAALLLAGGDTLAGTVDSMAVAATGALDDAGVDPAVTEAVVDEVVDDMGDAARADEAAGVQSHAGSRANEQIITAHTARTSVVKEYSHLSGLGTFVALGDVLSPVFSSGIILMITGILMLLYGLLCIGLPILNLYAIFGLNGSTDDKALIMKKYMQYNWLPLILLTLVIGISFVGAEYGFDVTESFSSFGDAYSIAVLLGTLSWGVFVSLAASVLVAVKGIEI